MKLLYKSSLLLILTSAFLLGLTLYTLAGPGAVNKKAGEVEIISQRTYNQEVFDIGNSQKRYLIHTAQIHYKDQLGNFQKIDTTLSFDDAAKSWTLSKASYKPVIPEYADGVFEFYNNYEGANFNVKSMPLAAHVKGQYFKDADGSNYVLYKDAFGKGIDLKVLTAWYGLAKVVVLNSKPADTSKDLTFDFQMQMPETTGFEIKKQDKTKFDFKQKNSKLDFTGKTILLGANEKYTYIKDAYIWDSAGKRLPVDIQLYTKNGKLYLRKTVKANILQKAVYPLYTDDTNYYAGAGDGDVYYGQNFGEDPFDWSAIYGAALATAVNTINATAGAGYQRDTTEGNIRRALIPIDTSGIGAGKTVTAAVLNFYVTASSASSYNLVQTTQANTALPQVGDYDGFYADAGATARDMSSTGWQTWGLNATGVSWVQAGITGWTKLGIRIGEDTSDDPGVGPPRSFAFATSENKGGDAPYYLAPYLDVTVITNTAPSIGTGPSDGGSSTTTPTVAGNNVTFTATATDPDNPADNYYLAICKTNAITAVNNGAPTCGGGNWCISGSTASASQATCNYATANADSGSQTWYAFVCDYDAASACSASSQGSGDNGSPFVVTPTSSYWVGGAGNWSDAATEWALTSGGAATANALPVATTNVYFDANSGTGTVTVDTNVYVASFTHSKASLTVAMGVYGFTVTGASSITNGTVTIGISAVAGWSMTNMTVGASGVITCSGASKIFVSGNWDSSAGTFTPSTSTVTFNGSSAQTINTGASTFDNVTFSNSAAEVNINYTGALSIGANVTLTQNTSISSTNNSAITVIGTINGANMLTINAGNGAVTLRGIIGGSTPITSLSVLGAGTTTISATAITTRDVANNNVSFAGPVTLDWALAIDTNNTTNDGTITFSSTINGAYTLSLDNGGGAVTFGGIIGGTAAITSLSVSGTTGTTTINTTGITTRNAADNNVSFAGPVILGANPTITTDTAGMDGSITFSSTINGAYALVLANGSGTVTFGGIIGGTAAITSLSVGGTTGTTTINTTGITTRNAANNNVSFAGPVILYNSINITTDNTTYDGTITFSSTINGTQTLALVAGGGNITVTGAVGGVTPLGAMTVTSSAALLFSSTVNITGAFTQTNAATGTTTFSNTLAAGSAVFRGTTINLGGTTTITGNLAIAVGTLDVTAGNYALNVAGNWSNSGTFTARSGTVTLNGALQTISGDTAFYNLTKDVSAAAADTLTFTAGSVQTIAAGGTATLKGASGKVLTLVSSSTGTRWVFTITSGASYAVSYVNVKDSDASRGSAINATNSVDSGNNLNWGFDVSAPPVPSNFVPVADSTITSTPTITFTLSAIGDCRAATTDLSYDDMASYIDCAGDNTLAGSCQMGDLGANGLKTIYISCKDIFNNKDTAGTNHSVTYTLAVPASPKIYIQGKLNIQGKIYIR